MLILLFLANELCDPHVQRDLRLPLEFIGFAVMPLHMYEGPHTRRTTFLARHTRSQTTDVVYGGLFLLRDADYYLRILDGYHLCSLSTLGRNHIKDEQHRITYEATPISFATLDELASLRYTEREPIHASVYVGNPYQTKIYQCLQARARRRVKFGIHHNPLTNLLREVLP